MLPLEESTPSTHIRQDVSASQDTQADKSDFFQAREENKAMLASQMNQYQSRYPPVGLPNSHGSSHVASSQDNHLVASSLQFLNSPTKDELPTPVPAEGTLLDDTSAYSFEISKKAAQARNDSGTTEKDEITHKSLFRELSHEQSCNTASAIEERPVSKMDDVQCSTPEEEQPAVASGNIDLETKLSGKKRKIDAISRTTLEEEHLVLAPLGNKRPDPESSISTAVLANTHAVSRNLQSPHVSYHEQVRPIKRLRRAAEVFGYVALGGVAVMSALIATAPAL